MDAAGNLYGQLAAGPFELSPSPRGWTEEIISPYVRNSRSGLTMDAAGNIYGTTIQGGANDMGTVFELNPSGQGQIPGEGSLEFQRQGRKWATKRPDSGRRRQPLWHDSDGRIVRKWRRVRSYAVERSSTSSRQHCNARTPRLASNRLRREMSPPAP
jgi:uncharacterized repeat protein (TIGR03803 family)